MGKIESLALDMGHFRDPVQSDMFITHIQSNR